MTDDRRPFGAPFDPEDADGSVEGHLGGSRWGTAPERSAARGLWERDLRTGPVEADVLAETDALLDRLSARRPTPEDLDDPAVGVLAVLAAEVDMFPVPPDALRAELFDRGVWPLVPSGTAPAAFLPETEVLDLRAVRAEREALAGGPAWRPEEPAFPQPGLRAAFADAARVPAPRQVRVKLLAVAAAAVVGLYGLAVGVTGAWSPWHAGTIIAGVDEGTQIQEDLRGAIQLVRDNDLTRGKAVLEDAYARAQEANLTPEQKILVDKLLKDVSTALTAKGVFLPVDLQPGRIGVLPSKPVVTPVGPSGAPTTAPTTGATPSGSPTSVPADPTSGATITTSEPEPSTTRPTQPEPSTTKPTQTPEPTTTKPGNGTKPPKGKSPTSKTRGNGS